MSTRWYRFGLFLFSAGAMCTQMLACDSTDSSEAPSSFQCDHQSPAPYPPNIPYAGIHGGPLNNDFIPCEMPLAYTPSWHALGHTGIPQPNTFSPDGQSIYVTTTEPTEGDCSVHALSTDTGEPLWCLHLPAAQRSSVEVDEEGMLYVTSNAGITCLDSEGNERWNTPMPEAMDGGDTNGALGLHFTPDGHIATMTLDGTVLLVARGDGEILASLNVMETWGYVPGLSLDNALALDTLMPASVVDDFMTLHGIFTLGAFTGSGGRFTDNTVAIAPDGTLYAVGGGVDPDHGAVVQIRVEGTAEAPELSPGWAMGIQYGSASSPAISPDGRWVKVADGNSPGGVITPTNVDAGIRMADITACDANTDSDPDPAICAPALQTPLLLGPMLGTTPMLDGPLQYIFEVQLATLFQEEVSDVRAVQDDTILWETHLPDSMQWSSIITATENVLIGTATRMTPSETIVLGLTLPQTAESELMLLARDTGDVIFRAPIPADSTSTVTIGPDGSLYVTMYSLLHIFALDVRPQGGIMKFSPIPD